MKMSFLFNKQEECSGIHKPEFYMHDEGMITLIILSICATDCAFSTGSRINRQGIKRLLCSPFVGRKAKHCMESVLQKCKETLEKHKDTCHNKRGTFQYASRKVLSLGFRFMSCFLFLRSIRTKVPERGWKLLMASGKKSPGLLRGVDADELM